MHSVIDLLKYGLEYCGIYPGVYKAKVISVDDPDNRGRLMIQCPQVHGTTYPAVWAEPKASMGGSQFGFWHVPDVGEWVYVHFDHGRAEFPIWDGGWWAKGDPSPDMTTKKVALVTKEGLKIVLDRDAKTVLIQSSDGVAFELSDNQVKIMAPMRVAIDSTVEITGGLHVGTGASGLFYTPTGQVVTVTDGIITSLE